MTQSTMSRRPAKPAKPHKDFPLFAHHNGSWAKKVRGKLHYFGGWGDPDAAIDEWLRQKDDLLAGRSPRAKQSDGLTIKRLADTFLTAKRRRVDSGELYSETYREYVAICQAVADEFGKDRLVEDLRPADFAKLRSEFAKIHGTYRLGKDVRVTRMLFKYGIDNDLIAHVVKFGSEFREPNRKARRRAKRGNGKRYFDADEIRLILEALDGKAVTLLSDDESGEKRVVTLKRNPTLKAMILLAVNAGLGNTDLSELRHRNITDGWLDYPRVKTEIERRCPLWPETQEALAEAAKHRPEPKDSADYDLVFVTRFGQKWVRLSEHEDPAKRNRIDGIAQEHRKVSKALRIFGSRGFYAYRHSHRTASGEARDKPAADLIMGHTDPGMSAEYTHHISDERLLDVVETVKQWLWPPPALKVHKVG